MEEILKKRIIIRDSEGSGACRLPMRPLACWYKLKAIIPGGSPRGQALPGILPLSVSYAVVCADA